MIGAYEKLNEKPDVIFVPANGSGNNSNGGIVDPNTPDTPAASTAGFGWVVGIVIVGIAYSLATSKKELVSTNKNKK